MSRQGMVDPLINAWRVLAGSGLLVALHQGSERPVILCEIPKGHGQLERMRVPVVRLRGSRAAYRLANASLARVIWQGLFRLWRAETAADYHPRKGLNATCRG